MDRTDRTLAQLLASAPPWLHRLALPPSYSNQRTREQNCALFCRVPASRRDQAQRHTSNVRRLICTNALVPKLPLVAVDAIKIVFCSVGFDDLHELAVLGSQLFDSQLAPDLLYAGKRGHQ